MHKIYEANFAAGQGTALRDEESCEYVKHGIDGSVHYFKKKEDLWCWNSLMYDFKPWISGKYRTLYRTRDYWVVKDNGISTVIKYKSFWKALFKFLYYQFHAYTGFITKIKLYFKVSKYDKPQLSFFRKSDIPIYYTWKDQESPQRHVPEEVIRERNTFWDVAYGGVFKKKDPNQTIT
jgi:hypothetical protein